MPENRKRNNLLVFIYGHPESYPPTLNALSCLAQSFDEINIVYRPYFQSKWEYPKNVRLHPSGRPISAVNQEQSGTVFKISLYLIFIWKCLIQLVKSKPSWILIYDFYPMLATRILFFPIKFFKSKIWYHSHDVPVVNKKNNLLSINGLSRVTESKMFNYIHLFTVPSLDRFGYYEGHEKSKCKKFLPNYPSKFFYSEFKGKGYSPSHVIKFIYQGAISNEHGLHQLCELLSLGSLKGEIHLAGINKNKYVEFLTTSFPNVSIKYHGKVDYYLLPRLTSSCHIGWAVNKTEQIIYKTGGTASNKIYEYAACGLPILYYDSSAYNRSLEKYDWAQPTNLSTNDLLAKVEFILENHKSLSEKAKTEFNENLNFENVFAEINLYLNSEQ